MRSIISYTKAAVERAMKVQEVILRSSEEGHMVAGARVKIAGKRLSLTHHRRGCESRL